MNFFEILLNIQKSLKINQKNSFSLDSHQNCSKLDYLKSFESSAMLGTRHWGTFEDARSHKSFGGMCYECIQWNFEGKLDNSPQMLLSNGSWGYFDKCGNL